MNVNDYYFAAHRLSVAMREQGFLSKYPIPIDPNGELLNGSHRLACAIALGIKEVPVERKDKYVWAPEWGIDWFEQNWFNTKQIQADWDALNAAVGSTG